MTEFKFDYKKMQKGKYGIPTYGAFAYPVLKLLSDGHARLKNDIKQQISDSIGLPEELRIKRYEKTKNVVIVEDRVSFAISHLYLADALTRSNNIYEITDDGRNLLKEYGDKLTAKIIKQQPAFLNRNDGEKTDNDDPVVEIDDSPASVIDDYQNAVDQINKDAVTELLKSIIEKDDPYFFEEMVVKLLKKMGYSNQGGDSWVTKRSGDGGIDGVINRDPLGTSTVYVQAKKYKFGNNVGISLINEFGGALKAEHADRGVFITTSDFTKAAYERANSLDIVAINGERLKRLMRDYHVGLKVKAEIEILEVDSEFLGE